MSEEKIVNESFYEEDFIEESEEILIKKNNIKEKHRKRRHGNVMHKKKLESLAKNCNGYPLPAYPVGKMGKCANEESDIKYYKKVYKSKHASRFSFFKTYSNKVVRQNNRIACHNAKRDYENERNLIGTKRATYKKLFDYSWNVY